MSKDVEPSLIIERTYKADVAELWDLWTTKDGFESWWGPDQFRADVITIEPRQGGALHYTMVADTPEAIAAMERMGAPTSQVCRGMFREFKPNDRLVLTQVIDFLPGVAPYDSTIAVDFLAMAAGTARMVVTLSPMHDRPTTIMQKEGFTSQLAKLDSRWRATVPVSRSGPLRDVEP
ncbi:SRPBCC family protein [Microvirga antarctica]|uniref:SRPBCC family protein n=1 Tax=Microvirga antarctica TaxID=2819233 RepID=UPI001B31563B|nr:SRPBCC domain-containing protein [Microvirga antarctica]